MSIANRLPIQYNVFLLDSIGVFKTIVSSLYVCLCVLLTWLSRGLSIPRIIIPHEIHSYMKTQFGEDVKHLTKISCIAMRIERCQ